MKYFRIENERIKAAIAVVMTDKVVFPSEIHGIVRYYAKEGSEIITELKEYLATVTKAIKTTRDTIQPLYARIMVADEKIGHILLNSDICGDSARSIVIQTPLDGADVAIWIVWTTSVDKKVIGDNIIQASDNLYRILWQGDVSTIEGDSYSETVRSLTDLAELLKAEGSSLSASCQRTWFVVRDIDNNYNGIVDGRNKVFKKYGLTRHTHFIASTGIGGSPVQQSHSIAFNSYSVLGLPEKKIQYLKVPEMMNDTMDYGVAFERGTILDFPDCRQILISGTASIDNLGRIMHKGDVVLQTHRMLENIDALISEAGASRSDMCYSIVYLRNPEDYRKVNSIIAANLGETPYVIVHAPVCRKGWLIEMECSLLLDRKTDILNE